MSNWKKLCTSHVLENRVCGVFCVSRVVENTITYLFSVRTFNPTPAASTIIKLLILSSLTVQTEKLSLNCTVVPVLLGRWLLSIFSIGAPQMG